jgi:hypothetical protein
MMRTIPLLGIPLLGLVACLSSRALAAAPDWKLQPLPATQKVTASAPGVLDPFTAQPIQLRAVRGEWENFQFVITAGAKRIENLKITINGLASPGGTLVSPKNLELYRENYVFVSRPSGNKVLTPKWWPDALIPIELADKAVEANKSAVYWGSLKVPDDAPPGDYYGELDFAADGAPRRLAIILQVEDKPQPAPTLRGTVALYYDTLREWYAKDGRFFSDVEWTVQKKRYYEFLLGYRINAYDLPVSWSSPEAETYLRDKRVLSVRTPQLDSPGFALALEKFKATGTLHKAFYYWIDEPQTPEQFKQVRETTKKLRALGVAHLVTAHPNKALQDAVDIWCPNIGDFFGIGHLDHRALAQERKAGRETWFYTMVEPRAPQPTWLLDDDAAAIRSFGPYMARHGFTGFVYSMVHGWGPKPLENLESFAGTNGDGTLLYPSELVGGVGPMPSIRLMLLRDALEEAERLKLSPPSVEVKAKDRVLPPASSAIIKRQGAPETKVSWRRDAQKQNLIVHFRVAKPQEADYVAVELAPLDLDKSPEKWRFVATRKGKLTSEKWTREGHLSFDVKGFSATRREAAGEWNVEMRVPLSPVDEAGRFRFDALRRTSVGGVRVSDFAFSRSGDPYAMPILDSSAGSKSSKSEMGRAKPPSR